MQELHEVMLAEKTTFRIGGQAQNFYIPENTDEVLSLIRVLKGRDYRIISGGSNLLINDIHAFDNVIYCGEFDKELIDFGDGDFYIGASNRIQKVISFVNDCGYGGFEELIGLPAMFGGIIYMNAGIGSRVRQRFNICDFIKRVKCIKIESEEIVWLTVDECQFSYRNSVFKNNKYLILGAEIHLEPQSYSDSQERINKRKEYIKNHQEWGRGCFGSCFSQYSRRLLKMSAIMNKYTIKGGTPIPPE